MLRQLRVEELLDDGRGDHGRVAPDHVDHRHRSDVMKRIAAPMIGGMVSSTVLTLLVIPVLYALWRGRSMFSGAPPLLTETNLSLQKQKGINVSERENT